ncbi:Kinesin-like protein KIN-14S [Camellia lanceoleosa]|uniref:Kinesin-like protein KIN-14S n=1 Tax=Camellia lanceoleosa TaxID=1840588 RepID=A0ACC0GH42_9ERIC|nr:Kinesin-like protein KIN-14S [Camellia lanceoleosa]
MTMNGQLMARRIVNAIVFSQGTSSPSDALRKARKVLEDCRREKSSRKHREKCELVKEKYLEECSKRKWLYNEVIELKGNIRVFCKCRPLSQDEIANGSTSVVDFDSSQENELQIICSDSSRKQFKFDHVFRLDDNQEAVFVQTSPIVTHL